MLTIDQVLPAIPDLKNANYKYQLELTKKLDDWDLDFNQQVINEIVLWKVNRYVTIDNPLLQLINQIKKTDKKLDSELTTIILQRLLCKNQKGIRLPMASSILRFKNPTIYQVIDQRVYRFIYGEDLKSTDNIENEIKKYFNYLVDLREKADKLGIEFESADRVFYSMDKKYNVKDKLKNF